MFLFIVSRINLLIQLTPKIIRIAETWADEPRFTSTTGNGFPGMSNELPNMRPVNYLFSKLNSCMVSNFFQEKMLMALMNAVGKNEDDEQESKFQVHIGLGVRARSAFCNRQRSESFDDFVMNHAHCSLALVLRKAKGNPRGPRMRRRSLNAAAAT